DLEELAVLGLHLHVAGQARVVDCQRIAVPRERALQPRAATLDEVGIAHALEELAAIGCSELEVRRRARRAAGTPNAFSGQRCFGTFPRQLLEPPIFPCGLRHDLDAAELLLVVDEALGDE